VSLGQEGTVAAYEELRSAVLSAQIRDCSGLGVLRRAGLATWLRSVADSEQSPAALSHQSPPAPVFAQEVVLPNALTSLMAGLIVALAKETMHA
jgi:hypothetical protein